MTPKQLLEAYFQIATEVDLRARMQEDRAKQMIDLARLARTDPDEARKQSRLTAPTVWDFGSVVSRLRALQKKSAKIIRSMP